MNSNPAPWYLYLVEHPLGVFIGVARSESEAREHFGNRARITLMNDVDILEARASGKPERVFLGF